MRISTKAIVAAAVVLMAGTFCYGADQIDNPMYKSWAKYKPGTTVTMKTDIDMAGTKMASEMTTTLKELTAEKAVLEIKSTTTMMGTSTPAPAQTMEVMAKVDKPPEVKTDAPKADVKEGTEEVEIPGGKKVKAKWTESKTSANGMDTVSKVWTSEEVPGGTIKMETTTDGAMKGTTKGALTAVDVK